MRIGKKSKLAGIVLGAVGALSGLANRTEGKIVELNFENPIVGQGQQSSYLITVNPVGSVLEPYAIIGFDFSLSAQPSGISSIDGHDIFSTGTDYSGNYKANSFLPGNNVSDLNIIHNNDGSIITEDPESQLPVGVNGDAIRYFFTASNVLGEHTRGISSATVGVYIEGVPQSYGVPSTQRGSDSFIVAIPGDCHGSSLPDGDVDISDLGVLAGNFGNTGMTWMNGDFNNDGYVGISDLGILAGNFGEGMRGAYTLVSGNSGALVPEPSTGLVALALGAGALMRRGRREERAYNPSKKLSEMKE